MPKSQIVSHYFSHPNMISRISIHHQHILNSTHTHTKGTDCCNLHTRETICAVRVAAAVRMITHADLHANTRTRTRTHTRPSSVKVTSLPLRCGRNHLFGMRVCVRNLRSECVWMRALLVRTNTTISVRVTHQTRTTHSRAAVISMGWLTCAVARHRIEMYSGPNGV